MIRALGGRAPSGAGAHVEFQRQTHAARHRPSEAAECGLACLAMVASYRASHRPERAPAPASFSLNGVTLDSVIEIASHLNLTSRAVRLEPEHLRQLKLPAILHWDMNHFVVLKSVARRGPILHRPCHRREAGILERGLKTSHGVASADADPQSRTHGRAGAPAPVELPAAGQRRQHPLLPDPGPVLWCSKFW